MTTVLFWLAATLGCSFAAAILKLRERTRDRRAEDCIRARMKCLAVEGADVCLSAVRPEIAAPGFGRRPPAVIAVPPPAWGRRHDPRG